MKDLPEVANIPKVDEVVAKAAVAVDHVESEVAKVSEEVEAIKEVATSTEIPDFTLGDSKVGDALAESQGPTAMAISLFLLVVIAVFLLSTFGSKKK